MSRVMARTNGKSEIEPQELDTQHELPPADGADEATGDPPQLGTREDRAGLGAGKVKSGARLGNRPVGAIAGGVRERAQACGAGAAGFSRIRVGGRGKGAASYSG